MERRSPRKEKKSREGTTGIRPLENLRRVLARRRPGPVQDFVLPVATAPRLHLPVPRPTARHVSLSLCPFRRVVLRLYEAALTHGAVVTRRTRSTGRWLARRRAPSLRASLATAVPSRRHASPGARVRATQPAARRRFQPRPSMDTRRRRAQSRATPTSVRWVQPCRHQAKASAPQQQEAKRRLTREESICPRGKNGCFFDAGRGRRVRQWPPMIPRLATPDRRQVLLLVLCSKGGRTKGPGNLAGRMRIGRGAFASTSLAARAVAM